MGDASRNLPENLAGDLADVIGKTIAGLPEPTYEARQRIYAKARRLQGQPMEESGSDAGRTDLVERAIAIVESRHATHEREEVSTSDGRSDPSEQASDADPNESATPDVPERPEASSAPERTDSTETAEADDRPTEVEAPRDDEVDVVHDSYGPEESAPVESSPSDVGPETSASVVSTNDESGPADDDRSDAEVPTFVQDGPHADSMEAAGPSSADPRDEEATAAASDSWIGSESGSDPDRTTRGHAGSEPSDVPLVPEEKIEDPTQHDVAEATDVASDRTDASAADDASSAPSDPPSASDPAGSRAAKAVAVAGLLVVAIAGAWLLAPSGDDGSDVGTVVAQLPSTPTRAPTDPLPSTPSTPSPAAAPSAPVPSGKESRPTVVAEPAFASQDRFDPGAPSSVDPELTPDAIAQSKLREADPLPPEDGIVPPREIEGEVPSVAVGPVAPSSEGAAPASPSDRTVPTAPPSDRTPQEGGDVATPPVPSAPAATKVDPGSTAIPPGSDVAAQEQSDPAPPGDAQEPKPAAEPTASDATATATVPDNAVVVEEAGESASSGVTWSTTDLSPQDGAPTEPSVMARARMPEEGLELVLTIRRNTDDQVPASHVLEVVFRRLGDAPADPVVELGAIVFGDRPASATEPLAAFPAKIEDDHFVVVLNRFPGVSNLNLGLMEKGAWLDLAVQRSSGKSQILSLGKGTSGGSVFSKVLQGWRDRERG